MNIENNTIDVKIQVTNEFDLDPEHVVQITKQGEKYVEVMSRDRPTKQGIKKISATEYVELRTGEVKQFANRDSKQNSNLRKTFARLRALIRTNFSSDADNQLFVTITYRENMTDANRLYGDFKNFMKRVKYCYSEHNFDYIAVAEPQGRGAWHLHLMLKTNKPVLYLDQVELTKIWGLGNVRVEKLKSDDVGSYYVAYFTDLLAEDAKGNKRRKKGARLHLYPSGFKLYRTSRGIQQPTVDAVKYADVLSDYGKPIYARTYGIVKENEIVNKIYKSTHKRE